jgi:DNA-binding response OmpR family regulator
MLNICCKHKALLCFALIVLDLGLPDIDGLELMSRLRHLKTPLPILILTAQDGVNDRIKGIEQGAGPMCCQSLSGCFFGARTLQAISQVVE